MTYLTNAVNRYNQNKQVGLPGIVKKQKLTLLGTQEKQEHIMITTCVTPPYILLCGVTHVVIVGQL